jgi:hypothetical protein
MPRDGRCLSPASDQKPGPVHLFLIVPSMRLSFLDSTPSQLGLCSQAVATISRGLGLATLIAFFLWRNAAKPSVPNARYFDADGVVQSTKLHYMACKRLTQDDIGRWQKAPPRPG